MSSYVGGIAAPIVVVVDPGRTNLALGTPFARGWQDTPEAPMLPVGAMWMGDLGLEVRTPGGDWRVDRPDSKGARWTRSGTPPLVTVVGSILFTWPQPAGDGTLVTPDELRAYHGHLRDGRLEEC